jgi:hypothetical protein
MKFSYSFLFLWFSLGLGQQYPECTAEMTRTDECLAVINANACYNKYRFGNNDNTLTCIEGKDKAEKSKRVSLSQAVSLSHFAS